MKRKSDIELARAERADIVRTITRLKYRILANREINEVLSDSLDDFDRQVSNGELPVLDLPEVLDVTIKDS